MGSAGKQASNINIKYSDFIAMMESKQVEDVTVDLSEGLLYIVPNDGYVYTAENGHRLHQVHGSGRQGRLRFYRRRRQGAIPRR